MTPTEALPRVYKLIHYIARRKARRGFAEDVAQEAVVIFLAQWDWYDKAPEHLPQFTKFCVLSAVGRVCRRSAVDRRTVDLSEKPGLSGFDFPVCDPPTVETADRDAWLYAALDRLPAHWRMIVTRHHGLGGADPASIATLGDEFGCNHQNVRQHYNRAVKRLRESLQWPPQPRTPRPKPARSGNTPGRAKRPLREGEPACVHCQARPRQRPRGLCWRCFYLPGVREQYGSGSKRVFATVEGGAP
jgi:RNA polymerase sigma factor (sigma-70 family)